MNASMIAKMTDFLNGELSIVTNHVMEVHPAANPQICSYTTDFFALRWYAQFIRDNREATVFLNLQKVDDFYRIWGDISNESGRVIVDLLDVRLPIDANEALFMAEVRKFTFACKENISAIIEALKCS